MNAAIWIYLVGLQCTWIVFSSIFKYNLVGLTSLEIDLGILSKSNERITRTVVPKDKMRKKRGWKW